MCEGVIVGLKVQRRPSVSSELEEMPRIWNICQGKPQIANRGSRASLTESQKATGVRCPSPLAFTPCHHLPQVLDMELMNLMFTLLGFWDCFSPSFSSCVPIPAFWNENIYMCLSILPLCGGSI
jgi:hypothetical protein